MFDVSDAIYHPPMTLDALERCHIAQVMAAQRGDKVTAAQILGVNLSTVYRKLERYRVEARM